MTTTTKGNQVTTEAQARQFAKAISDLLLESHTGGCARTLGILEGIIPRVVCPDTLEEITGELQLALRRQRLRQQGGKVTS